jgi:hypothetical protein
LSYDEILAALSDDPDAARLEFERQRANIEAGKLAERRRMALAQFRVYLETLDHQTLAWQRAMGRKKGPTANDHELKANFEVQLERYRQGLRDDPAFTHHDLLDSWPCLITWGGVPLGAGVTFGLEQSGQTLQYRVEAVGFRSTHDGKWVKAVSLEDQAGCVFQGRELDHLC